jgi:cyclopropane fatty-acyl-phospholipid synthase-like methyltransferase
VVPAESYLGGDIERTRRFVRGMHDRAVGIGRALVAMVDLAGRSRLLDVGGGAGTYSALFCQAHPGLSAVVLELPGVAAIAREILAEMGAEDRVETLAGDYHETPFPAGCDVILMSGMFHRETDATCRDLIVRAHACLPAGGLLVVSDVFTDADAPSPFAILFGLNMALSAPDGGVHAAEEVARWMTDTGFDGVAIRAFPPPLPHRVVTGKRR